MMSPEALEHEVLVNRFIYYVMDSNILSDYAYDQLEREARAVCPPASPVHGIGSSLRASYSKEVATDATNRIS